MLIENIPDDCITLIMADLSTRDIINLSYVNKRFNRLTKEVLSIRSPNDVNLLIIIKLEDIHKVPIEYYGNISFRCNMENVKQYLRSVNTFNINGFYLSGYCDEFDNSILYHMTNAKYIHINFNNYNIDDISILSNVKRLSINNSNVNDVSMLTNVLYLEINRTKVTNVNMLTQLLELHIAGTEIKDISKLINLKYLNASATPIEDISMLTNLTYLDMYQTSVKDVSTLINLKYLDIDYTPIKNVRTLTRLRYLSAFNTEIDYINNLEQLNYLFMDGTLISDISNLPYLINIDIDNTPFVDLHIRSIESLCISDCESIENINIDNISMLTIKNLPTLVHISNLMRSIKELVIVKCYSIDHINIENAMDVVKCKECSNLKNININFNRVNNISIESCPLINLSDISNVNELNIFDVYSKCNNLTITQDDSCKILDITDACSTINGKFIIDEHTTIDILHKINKLTVEDYGSIIEYNFT